MHGIETAADHAPTPDRTPEIEAMCAEITELRSHAARLEDQAKQVEVRLLGPMPTEEGPAIAQANVPCLTGVVGTDIRLASDSLHGVGHSLDRIVKELGSIGQE